MDIYWDNIGRLNYESWHLARGNRKTVADWVALGESERKAWTMAAGEVWSTLTAAALA